MYTIIIVTQFTQKPIYIIDLFQNYFTFPKPNNRHLYWCHHHNLGTRHKPCECRKGNTNVHVQVLWASTSLSAGSSECELLELPTHLCWIVTGTGLPSIHYKHHRQLGHSIIPSPRGYLKEYKDSPNKGSPTLIKVMKKAISLLATSGL